MELLIGLVHEVDEDLIQIVVRPKSLHVHLVGLFMDELVTVNNYDLPLLMLLYLIVQAIDE